METLDSETSRKRMKQAMESKEGEETGGAVAEVVEGDIEETNVGSEEMELRINAISHKIERFTNLVSDMLEAGKTVFRDLSNDFEERMIAIHKEQMDKWQDEIKELRMLDASNEEADALLQNARLLLQSIHHD